MATKTPSIPDAFTTEDLRSLLSEMHPGGEWAFMQEVAPRTGGGTRYADALAFNLWKSRGYAVHGFEIKVSRADWRKELKAPAKAEEIFGYCDYWWVVAAPGLVQTDELPPGWGLLEPVRKRGKDAATAVITASDSRNAPGINRADINRYRLGTVVKAGKLTPQPLSREFFASIIRRSHEGLDDIVRARTYDEIRKMREESDKALEKAIAKHTSGHEALKKNVDEFEQATGLTITRWSGPPIEVVRLAQKLMKFQGYGEKMELFASIGRMADQLERQAEEMRKTITSINDQVEGREPQGTALEKFEHQLQPQT